MSICVNVKTQRRIRPEEIFDSLDEKGMSVVVTNYEFPCLKFGVMQYSLRGIEVYEEDYGYAVNDCIPDKNVGDRINAGEYIYKSDNYDDDGNFGMGVNLKAVYTPELGKTYEDGFVITESGAEKLKSYKVEKTLVSINTNDVLLNLYSDLNEKYDTRYHSIPKVGEHTKGNILVASRREESQNVLYNFQQKRMKEIDANDQVYYTCGGIIADINVFSNTPLEQLKQRSSEFSKEIVELYEDQLRYNKELAEILVRRKI